MGFQEIVFVSMNCHTRRLTDIVRGVTPYVILKWGEKQIGSSRLMKEREHVISLVTSRNVQLGPRLSFVFDRVESLNINPSSLQIC